MSVRRPLVGLLAVAVLLLGPAATANAATSDPPPDSTSTSTPMVVGGYNEAVAEAHGFKIVTNSDGTQQSVPVTKAASALLAEAAQKRAAAQTARAGATPNSTGNCGSSWLSGSKLANDTVGATTGFQVYLAGYEYDWKVTATGFWSGGVWNVTNVPGPATGYMNKQIAIYGVVGPGIAGVPRYSWTASVTLVDGTVCYSTGPSFNFG